MQLKDPPQGVQHMQLHQPLLGKPLGESGQGGGACHGGFSPQVTENRKADVPYPAFRFRHAVKSGG
ncbi:hypothetical protein D9M72_576310 [compost metagenome]